MSHTCGLQCWTAQDDICHCSCNGANHGCLRTADGIQPTRSKKIQGVFYELHSVHHGYGEICKLLEKGELPNNSIRSVPSTKEINKWPELTVFRGMSQIDRIMKPPVCIWIRSEKYNSPANKG